MIELAILAADSSGNTFLISSILGLNKVSTDYYCVPVKFWSRNRLTAWFKVKDFAVRVHDLWNAESEVRMTFKSFCFSWNKIFTNNFSEILVYQAVQKSSVKSNVMISQHNRCKTFSTTKKTLNKQFDRLLTVRQCK